jgi:hypothetical protein
MQMTCVSLEVKHSLLLNVSIPALNTHSTAPFHLLFRTMYSTFRTMYSIFPLNCLYQQDEPAMRTLSRNVASVSAHENE